MTLYRFISQSLRRSLPLSTTTTTAAAAIRNPSFLTHLRSLAFSSAEEAAAERRNRKRRLRTSPPLHALRPHAPPNPNAPTLPDTTAALVGRRLSLHNRVQTLIRAGDLDTAAAVTRHAVFSTTRPTVFTCNALTAAMCQAKRYDDVSALFTFFFNKKSHIVPNIVSYNVLINTHCHSGNINLALDVYRQIIANAPFSPSHVTFRHLTKGLIESGRIDHAIDLLREMLNTHGADSLVYNNLISGFLKLGDLERANELFDELKHRCLVYDGVVNATFMDWFFTQGRDKEAMECYNSLLDRGFRMVPSTCNVLLECLIKHGRRNEADEMFQNMLDSHTPPTFQGVNSDTFNIMVNDCFKLGRISEAFDVFKRVGKKKGSKPFAMDVVGYNNIIARYCELEMMEDAEKMYDEMTSKSLSPDVTTYRTLIDGYFKVGRVDDSLQKYTKMVEAGLRVIPEYANRWFAALIENGKSSECVPILTNMAERDPKPDGTTYEVVIRGLCSEGSLDIVLDLLSQMLRHNGVATPAFRQFLDEEFEKVGRKEEVERVLASNGYRRRPGSPRVPQSGPLR